MLRSYYLPPNIRNKEIYHEDWIDFNKNGKMDPYENPKLSVEERVEDSLSRMTIDEKISQLRSGTCFPECMIGNLTCVLRNLGPKEGANKANELQTKAIEDTRLGIPVIIHDECLHGCLAKFSTSFPQAIALAATWDERLVYEVAKAIASETRARGIHQCLSPVVNIARDIRAGRTEETFGEDPYLTSIMARVYCRAFREEGIIATPKHFVANFVGDGGRDSNEIHFSGLMLREIYFPGFKSSIKAGALSIMAAYNSLDGVPCSCNKWLLAEVLRLEWGFNGFVVSDYGSVAGIINKHRITDKPEEVAKLALEAGLDVELPQAYIYKDGLAKAIKSGLITKEVLDEAVRRVLRAKFLIGLFDGPFVNPDRAEKICSSREHSELALKAAREAMVLLKNEGVLPISKDRIKSIAVIGPLSSELKLGGYSGIPRRVITPLEGIKEKLSDSVKIYHAKGCPADIGAYIPISNKYLLSPEGMHGLKGEYFNNPDLSGNPVITRIDWRIRFDYGSRSPVSNNIFSARWTGKVIPPITGLYRLYLLVDGGGARLWINDKLLINSWSKISRVPLVADIRLEKGKEYSIKLEYHKISGNYSIRLSWDIIESEEIKEAVEIARKSDVAVVFVGIVEGEGKDRAIIRLPKPQERLIEEISKVNNNTIVVLITGSAVIGDWIYKVPGIVQAWYPGQEGGTAISDVLFGDYNPAGRLPFTWPRHEGQLPLYYNYKPTGRAYDYIDMQSSPLFPFGYGLSYTKFKYDNLRVEVDKTKLSIRVSLDVKNMGEREGDEVVQLYIHDLIASIARPVKELRRFKRVSLKPGESKTVVFTLSPDDLAMYNSRMRRIVEPGYFEIMIGSSSDDIRLKKNIYVDRLIKGEMNASMDISKEVVRPNEDFELTVKIKNTGIISDLFPVKIYIDKEVISHNIDLSPSESRTIKIKLNLPRVGKYKIILGFPEPRLSKMIEVK